MPSIISVKPSHRVLDVVGNFANAITSGAVCASLRYSKISGETVATSMFCRAAKARHWSPISSLETIKRCNIQRAPNAAETPLPPSTTNSFSFSRPFDECSERTSLHSGCWREVMGGKFMSSRVLVTKRFQCDIEYSMSGYLISRQVYQKYSFAKTKMMAQLPSPKNFEISLYADMKNKADSKLDLSHNSKSVSFRPKRSGVVGRPLEVHHNALRWAGEIF